MESLAGKFLISETELQDPNFAQSVVCLLEHNAEGAFGFVVNQRSTVSLGDILEEFTDTPASSLPVFIGGPVQRDFLFCLYSSTVEISDKDILEPIPGVFFNPDIKEIFRYLHDVFPFIHPEERPDIHFYAGYSGWSPGQLEREIRQFNSWVVLPANQGLIFAKDPEQSWRSALRKKGGIYYIAAEMGFKPSIN